MSVCHVLGVLEDDEYRLSAVCARSVALADAERARLTLAKTTDPGRLMGWFAPFAMQLMCACACADDVDLRVTASGTLARAVEFVPAGTPVTTLLLGQNTSSALVELLRRGCYDALVATDAFFGHHRRLRRELRRVGVSTVLVAGRPTPVTAPSPTATRADDSDHVERIGAYP